MFTITSNPFAEMTQGLSSLPRSSSSSLSIQSPPIQPDYNYYHKHRESSNGGWKVFFVILGLFSVVGVAFWLIIQKIVKDDKKKKLEEQKRLKEEEIQALSE